MELFFSLGSVKCTFDFISVGVKQLNGGTIIGAHGFYPRKLSEILVNIIQKSESFNTNDGQYYALL